MEVISLLDYATARTAIFLAKAYSHQIRRQILERLLACPDGSNVTDLYTKIKITKTRYMEQSVCSLHLAWLRKYNLVTSERRGKERIYRINRSTVEPLGDLLSQLAALAGPK